VLPEWTWTKEEERKAKRRKRRSLVASFIGFERKD
jgi:hypothetical protein